MTDIRDEVAAALQEAMTDTTGAVDYSPFADDLLGALAARGLTVVREGELDVERLPLNEYGRVECICGRTVLPQNWANHLLTVSYGRHRLARQPPWVRAQWDRRSSCLCGHAYRDHARFGTHCLAASSDSEQRTGQMCQCSMWEPLEPRIRKTARQPEGQ